MLRIIRKKLVDSKPKWETHESKSHEWDSGVMFDRVGFGFKLITVLIQIFIKFLKLSKTNRQ